MAATRRPIIPAGPPPHECALSVQAWNLMGASIDGQLLPWVVGYLGIEDVDALMLDLITIRNGINGK